MVYAAMDVHRKRSQLAIVQDDGVQLLNRSVLNRREDLVPLLQRLEPRKLRQALNNLVRTRSSTLRKPRRYRCDWRATATARW